MNAEHLLTRIARALADARLEAVMVGNAAAALQGAPVTTLDFDFMFRKTRANVAKLKRVADALDAVVLKPFYPASELFRVMNEDVGLQLDFMTALHGVRSYEALRSRATEIAFGGSRLLVSCLEDIIRSKRARGRPKDLAVLDVLEKTVREKGEADNEEGAA